MNILAVLLQLLAAAPGLVPEITYLIGLLKPGASPQDQAGLDALLAVLNPKVTADVATLQADANAASLTATA